MLGVSLKFELLDQTLFMLLHLLEDARLLSTTVLPIHIPLEVLIYLMIFFCHALNVKIRKGPGSKDLFPRVVLLGGAGAFGRWGFEMTLGP